MDADVSSDHEDEIMQCADLEPIMENPVQIVQDVDAIQAPPELDFLSIQYPSDDGTVFPMV